VEHYDLKTQCLPKWERLIEALIGRRKPDLNP